MNSVRSTEVSKSSNKIWQFECLKVRFMSLRNDISDSTAAPWYPCVHNVVSISVWFSVHCKDSIDFLSQWIYWFWWNVRLQRHCFACLGDSGGRGEADLQLQWEAWTGPLIKFFWKSQGIDKPMSYNVAWPIDCTCINLIFIIHKFTSMTWLWPSTVFIFPLSLSKSTSL